MNTLIDPLQTIPSWNLYGEKQAFPDVLHCERITDRAKGLDWRIAPHRHMNMHQFFIFLSGEVWITHDGENQHLTSPTAINIPPGIVHSFVFSAGTDGYVVSIPAESTPDLLQRLLASGSGLSQFGIVSDIRDIRLLAEKIYAEHSERYAARPIMLQTLVTELACLMMRALPLAMGTDRATDDERFRRFVALAHANLKSPKPVESLAAMLNISARHLGRLCVAATGLSPVDYIQDIRMREACRLLAYTKQSISDVGFELGFQDPSYFSRAFKRHIGLTPREYRNRLNR